MARAYIYRALAGKEQGYSLAVAAPEPGRTGYSAISKVGQLMSTAAERRDYTLKILRMQGHISVSDLSERFKVSEVTVRNDLRYLEESNLLLRTHGGAILPESYVQDQSFEEKAKRNADEKKRIGRRAASLVEDNDTIILDAGTTTMQVAHYLRGKRNLTVVTNAINIAGELLSIPELEVLILGGSIRPNASSVVGPFAEQMLRVYACRKLFLGVDGFDVESGLTTTNPLEAHLNQLMIKAAQKTIVVADASKFGLRGFSRICGIEDVDTVVTDDKISESTVKYLEDNDIQVLVC